MKNKKHKKTNQNKNNNNKNKTKQNNNNKNKNLEGSNVIPFIITCSPFFNLIFNQSEFVIEKVYFKKVILSTLLPRFFPSVSISSIRH